MTTKTRAPMESRPRRAPSLRKEEPTRAEKIRRSVVWTVVLGVATLAYIGQRRTKPPSHAQP
jgi:hypothetical protein